MAPTSGCFNPDCSQVNKACVQLKRCSRCRTARYCGRECQRAHYRVHKSDCLKLQTKKEDKPKNMPKVASMKDIPDAVDSLAEMMANVASSFAEKDNLSPELRDRMAKFSHDMNLAVAEERKKKATAEYEEPSWMYDEEKRKHMLAEFEKADQEFDAFYTSRGKESPRKKYMEMAIANMFAKVQDER